MIKVGDKLPEIRLQGTLKGETKDYSLADNGGKNTVLVFYPFAFTPV